MAEEEEQIEEPEEGEPEEEETPTEEPAVEPKKEQQREIVKPQGKTTKEENTCPHCGATVRPVAVDTDRGVRYRCPECNKFMTIIARKPEETTGESIYRGEVDENEILRGILEQHPDISSKVVDEIMSYAHFGPIQPYLVTALLGSMKDVKRQTAELTGYKYQMALSQVKRESPPSFPLFMMGVQQQAGANLVLPYPQQSNRSMYNQGGSTPWHPQQGQGSVGSAASRGLSKEDIREIIRSQNRERELEDAKEKLKALGKGGNTPNEGRGLTAGDFERMLDERRKKEKNEDEKNTLTQTLNSIGRTLENLNTRVSTMEHGETPEGSGKKKEGGLSEERLLQLLDERNKEKKGEEEKTAIMQTLNGIRLALDNLNTRISSVEQGGVSKKEEGSTDKKMLDVAVNRYIQLMERGELTEDRVRSIAKEIAPRPTSPPGTRNQYDMEVEKATHEADARKIEAEEKRKGYEAIAGGIRDGLGGIGWNIGAGAAGGSPRSGPSPEAQTEVGAPTTETQQMEWRDGFWYTRCVYSDCRAPMMFEDGKSTVMCPSCNRVIQVQPTEEELKQKVSAEKSKTPETKVEVKKKEPEREEPQREEPQREEEKPPETEEPKSTEEKPSAEAKPEVPEASEGSDAKATEEAQGTAG